MPSEYTAISMKYIIPDILDEHDLELNMIMKFYQNANPDLFDNLNAKA
jgi:hypothetical protein